MDITPQVSNKMQLVTGYGEGGFRVNGEWREGSLLVAGETLQLLSGTTLEQISLDMVAPALEQQPPVELLLLGTGTQMKLAPMEWRAALRAKGIAVEAMDTGAACRTYNVLLAEGRRVAAVLVAV